MFLPEGPAFRLPFCPQLGKHNLVYLCIVVGCLLKCPGKVTKLPKDRWVTILAVLSIVGGACTGLTNGDALIFGEAGAVVIPAMTVKDGLFVGISEFFPSCVAFYIGYALFRQREDVERLLVWLGVAGLIYSLFAIVEMRMSPQFHKWVYGYGMGGFEQTIRWGGYRPMVFMPHGLALARLLMTTTLALFVLTKIRREILGLPIRPLAWIHAVILVLCRSTGAIGLCLIGIVSILYLKPKRQLLLSTILAVGTAAYPILRAADLFPVTSLLDAAGSIQEDRRGSLGFRFANEDQLLARARERIIFGWGTYGRNRVFDEAGRDVCVTDGYWILTLGIAGIVGFVVAFGLLLWPVVLAKIRLRRRGDRTDQILLAGLASIVVLAAIDYIPNGLWCVHPYLFAGVLTRRLRELKSDSPSAPGQQL